MEYGVTLTATQWTAVLASLVVAGFALLAGTIFSLTTQREVGARFRTSSQASAMLQAVALLAYVVLSLSWILGYRHVGTSYVPNTFHFDNGFRYVDWAVTVPLLMIELSAVLAVEGPAKQKLRAVLIPSVVLMIVAGWIGTDPAGNHDAQHTPLMVWGGISTVFFLIAFAVLYPALGRSRRELPGDTATSLRNVGFLLAFTWGVYPVLYLFPVFFGTSNAEAASVRQVLFSITDVAAKTGYGVLIHKIAKQRTALDVREGRETHPEAIYSSGERLAEARPA